MSLPINLDDYRKYLPMQPEEFDRLAVPDEVRRRVCRLRALYSYWIEFSTKSAKELVDYDCQLFGIAKSQAYDDVHYVKILVGDLSKSTKDFARWRINRMIEEDLRKARLAGDWRAVASMQKNYIKANMLDKEDIPEFQFDKIVPMVIEPTDDPSVIGIKPVKNLRQKINKLIKRYGADEDFSDFIELPQNDDAEEPLGLSPDNIV